MMTEAGFQGLGKGQKKEKIVLGGVKRAGGELRTLPSNLGGG